MRRYADAVPEAMRGAVLANLQAFMQRALDVDSGRYPSLPRFLHELTDLRAAPAEEAPDEGIVGDAGDAVRIYTVHGAKGLEAPIVWLLGAAAGQDAGRGYETQVDWPPEAEAPRSLTMWPRKDGQSAAQRRIAEEEAQLAERENLNLLYVAMTRAQQVLIVSGSEGRGQEGSWYDKVRAAVLAASGATEADGTVSFGDDLAEQKSTASKKAREEREERAARRSAPQRAAADRGARRSAHGTRARLRHAFPLADGASDRRRARGSRGCAAHAGSRRARVCTDVGAGAAHAGGAGAQALLRCEAVQASCERSGLHDRNG